jgi:hypothetical protein
MVKLFLKIPTIPRTYHSKLFEVSKDLETLFFSSKVYGVCEIVYKF